MPFEGIVMSKGLYVKLEISDGVIDADPDKLEHALSNLITNAIKYADKKIIISYSDNCLSIWNDGVTLSDEEVKHLFERFYTSSNGNTGIGLALSKEIIELHKWKIFAKKDNDGIRFTIEM